MQAIYQNLSKFDPKIAENAPENIDFEFDKKMFSTQMEYIIINWEKLNAIADKYEENHQLLPRCTRAILIAAFAELVQDAQARVINDYVEVAKVFVGSETKMINKVLDDYMKLCQKNEVCA